MCTYNSSSVHLYTSACVHECAFACAHASSATYTHTPQPCIELQPTDQEYVVDAVKKWDLMEKLWDHAFKDRLRILPEEHPMLLAVRNWPCDDDVCVCVCVCARACARACMFSACKLHAKIYIFTYTYTHLYTT